MCLFLILWCWAVGGGNMHQSLRFTSVVYLCVWTPEIPRGTGQGALEGSPGGALKLMELTQPEILGKTSDSTAQLMKTSFYSP